MKVGSFVVDMTTSKCIKAICLNTIKQCYVFGLVNSLPNLETQTRTHTHSHTHVSHDKRKNQNHIVFGKEKWNRKYVMSTTATTTFYDSERNGNGWNWIHATRNACVKLVFIAFAIPPLPLYDARSCRRSLKQSLPEGPQWLTIGSES